MKGRESGMPPAEMWERFFVPDKTLAAMGLGSTINDVAEFGCGYGTFTVPAARMVKGTVYSFDIEEEMLGATRTAARDARLKNIVVVLRDFVTNGTGLKDKSVDYVMLFNILHIENPNILLNESRRILRNNGRLGIIHWNYDPSTPRGPSMDIRVKPKQCIYWATKAGFVNPKQFDLKPYHYGILMSKKEGDK